MLGCGGTRNSGPAAKLRPHLSPGVPELPPERDPVEGIIAHKIWIEFFADRFEQVTSHGRVEQLMHIGRLLQITMEFDAAGTGTSHFSRHPNAAGTFFSVMLLGLKFSSWQREAKLEHLSLDYNLLEKQVYSTRRLVHIDFGFIFGTSPGGNMHFKNAQFKLSHDMTRLLDPFGSKKSETWMHFVSLCIKGYLVACLYMDELINTMQLMVDSGLPCFSRGDPIGNFSKRFYPEMSEHQATTFMIRVCEDAYNKWTTTLYNSIQYWQNGIKK